MRKYVLLLVVLVLALAACDDEQPPTQVYIVLSPTPETETAEAVTPDASPQPADTTAPTATTAANTAPTSLPATNAPATAASAAAAPETTITTTPTPLPALFPTNVMAQVSMAEVVFERGRMFWLRHNRQIWVMVAGEEDPNRGDWYCFNDTYQESEPEIDPGLTPPDGMYQPRRGFGKLWRSHADLKEALGWAVTPEFELTSNYIYIAGGYVENGKYFSGPGEHRLTTLYNEPVSFFESEIRGDCQGGTFRLTPQQ